MARSGNKTLVRWRPSVYNEYMGKTAVITARLDSDTLDALDGLAAVQDRTRAALIERAVKRFVREETEFRDFLSEGERAIDRGEFLTHDQMVTEIDRWKRARKSAS
jgi:predicted transcriptional regulator